MVPHEPQANCRSIEKTGTERDEAEDNGADHPVNLGVGALVAVARCERIIGMIAAALIVTFTNSLGAIAGRADSTQAERVRAKADQADDRAELDRITGERVALTVNSRPQRTMP